MKTVLLLHGWGGKGHKENWQNILAKKLLKNGVNIIYPYLKNPKNPKLNEWIQDLDEIFLNNKGAFLDDFTVITHSLGGVLLLHYLDLRFKNAGFALNFAPKKIFLIAPPLTDCGIKEISDFFPLPDVNFAKSPYNKFEPLLIHSDNDPFIPLKDFEEFSKRFNIPAHMIKNAGHINYKSGYGEWGFLVDGACSLL